MPRFVFFRRLITFSALSALLMAGNASFSTPVALADTSWADLLKPLVKDVIVPGASIGMKKLMARGEHKGEAQKTDATVGASTGTTSSTAGVVDVLPTSPEEPMSGSSEPSASIQEQYSSASADTPPPPVATP